MSDRGKLGSFLKEIIDWDWKQFCEAEADPKYTGYQAAVFSLVRTCSDGKLSAIKLSIDRVDGKVETPIKFEYPKIYFLFPEAQKVTLPAPGQTPTLTTGEEPEPLNEPPEAEEEPVKVTTMTLRQTLEKMADSPRQVPLLIHQRKKEVENDQIPEDGNLPLVKSVIVANLLILANEKNNFEAITEIFDQIDGKLVETIRILGEDIYLTSYALEAPYGATKNKDGVYQLMAPQIMDAWKEKLKKD
jgi:hypothetical protein